MEFEKEGSYYAVYQIKEDLNAEKSQLLDHLWHGSNASWGGADTQKNQFIIDTMTRVEEINRILQAVDLGFYNAP